MVRFFLAQVNFELLTASPEFELEWQQLTRAFYTKPLHIIDPDLKLLLSYSWPWKSPSPGSFHFQARLLFSPRSQ